MEIEFDILDLLQKLHTPIGDQVMCTITKLGNAGAIWIMLTLILLLIPKTRRCGAVLTVALIINTILCNGIIKPFVARPRPCDVNMAIQLLIPRPSDWSFPSGHTSAAFASASALFFHAYSSIGAAVSGSKGVTPLAEFEIRTAEQIRRLPEGQGLKTLLEQRLKKIKYSSCRSRSFSAGNHCRANPSSPLPKAVNKWANQAVSAYHSVRWSQCA